MNSIQKKKINESLTHAYEEYEKGLFSRASFKLGNPSLGKDLVQSTFLKTWKYLQKGGKIVLMKAFLYHVLNDLIIDEYRKNKTISLDQLLQKGFDPGVDESDSIINKMDGKVLFTLLNKLPKKYQKVLRMKYEEDLSLAEISKINHQTRNTVAVQIHRGLEKLKELNDAKQV